MSSRVLLSCCLLVGAASCGGGAAAPIDAGSNDAAGVSTAACNYVPLTPTARAGAAIAPGTLTAGAAEAILDVPVGTAMGGYTARAKLSGGIGSIDSREVPLSGPFNASVGVLSAPRVKAVALTVGDESVVILKLDVVFVYEGMLFDLEQRLGPSYAGKVLLASSHTHSGWAQFTGHSGLKLGASELRDIVYQRILDALEATARAAIAAQRPAQIGFFVDTHFDPDDVITYDRRQENDALMGGPRKDDHLTVIRIDGIDDQPIAIIPVYGIHGTLNDQTNPLASSDAPGAMERVLEEQFDNQVVVMHLNSGGADTAPTGHGAVDCTVQPGRTADPCMQWVEEEAHGRAALPTMLTAWQNAGESMQTSIALEMLSRSVETGPFPETFSIRDGAMTYAPFDLHRDADGVIWNPDGSVKSPIDEFNAPVGAALCESGSPEFPTAQMPNTDGLSPYGSCQRLDVIGELLQSVFMINFKVTSKQPICETTRTTISSLRLGDYLIGTLPGEVSVMLADKVRANSPVDVDHTIVVGYAQGHVGYMLVPEDWVLGGYEPSVTFWGPLEAEHIAEKLKDLMPLAMAATSSDGTTAGTTRVVTATTTDDLPIDDPAPMAGTVPDTVPTDTWTRVGTPTMAQPAAMISRVSGIATFVWIGDDPLTQTPHVQLQYETSPGSGTFAAVTRRSGRIVEDQEIVLSYTPEPLVRVTGQAQTHVWAVEWQAVPWLGAANLDSYDTRAGVPLGNYRFHVDGKNWSLDSQPFAVVAGGLEATAAATTVNGTSITVSIEAPLGWRALDDVLPSNRPVPVRNQAVTVTFLAADGTTVLATETGTTDGDGTVVVDGGNAATNALSVSVVDSFGNTANAPIPTSSLH